MNRYIVILAVMLFIWINAALYFITLSALGGALFCLGTMPVVAVGALKLIERITEGE